MLKTFEKIKDIGKPAEVRNSTDGAILRLFYPTTTLLLLVFCLLVCSREFLGEHIRCISDKQVDENVMNTYCFIQSTFTLHENQKGYDCNYKIPAHPGVRTQDEEHEIEKYHAYYQWVPFVLFLQAFSFMIPRFLWIHCEKGLLDKLYNSLTVFEVLRLPPKKDDAKKDDKKEKEKEKVPVILEKYKNDEKEKCQGEGDILNSDTKEKEKKEEKPKMLLVAEYFMNSRGTHQFMAFGWIARDYIALLVALANYFLTNIFLGGDFSRYGFEVFDTLSKDPLFSNGCIDAAYKIFPKVTKCTFYKYGPSGSIMNVDAMCILALNVINEKIYAFLFVWFIMLIAVTILGILYKLVLLLQFIYLATQRQKIFPGFTQKLLGAPITLPSKNFQVIRGKSGVSDWIFFSLFVEKLSLLGYKKFIYSLNNINKNIDYSEIGNKSYLKL